MRRIEIFGTVFCLLILASCTKDETPDPTPETPTGLSYNVPTTYAYEDADGNSTVSFSGQAERLEMLGEMTVYMKSANTAGVGLDAQQLKDMYANNGFTWADAPGLGMTGSTKQLKNKTAASSGSADPTIQAYFEAMMDSIAVLSNATVMGVEDGGNNQAGIVVSTVDNNTKYLMNHNGLEYTQFIEKGLMGAVFYNQITLVYLGPDKMNVDNTTAVDAAAGKFYTTMEHHWDEAYGYFTTGLDYPNNGTDRFWGKYANSREGVLGSATKLDYAFRRGRAAIANDDMTERDAQIAIIRTELELVCAGTAIHYLNDAVSDFGDDAVRNHVISEAVVFLNSLRYGHNPAITNQQIDDIIDTIGEDYYEVTIANLTSARDQLASIMGLDSVKEQL